MHVAAGREMCRGGGGGARPDQTLKTSGETRLDNTKKLAAFLFVMETTNNDNRIFLLITNTKPKRWH